MVKFIVKPRDVMGDYIACHWLYDCGLGIPDGEVWVREDWWADPRKRIKLILHERIELYYMLQGKDYREAHSLSNQIENDFYDAVMKDIDNWLSGDIMDYVRRYGNRKEAKKGDTPALGSELGTGWGLDTRDIKNLIANMNADNVKRKYVKLKKAKKKKTQGIPPSSKVTGLSFW